MQQLVILLLINFPQHVYHSILRKIPKHSRHLLNFCLFSRSPYVCPQIRL